MCYHNNKIFLFGGQESNISSGTKGNMYTFDISTNYWKGIKTEVKRAYADLIPINSTYMLLFGGWEENENKNDTLLWNIHHEEFEILDLKFSPSIRFSYSGVHFGNQVYVFGGKNKQQYFEDLYEFVFKETCLNFRYVSKIKDVHFHFY